MAKRTANNTIDVNTLVNAIMESQRASLTALFVTLGVQQITTHTASVPTQQAIATPQKPVQQSLPVAPPPVVHVPMPARASATPPAAPVSQGNANVASNKRTKSLAAPQFGDFHAQVGANRTKLPLGIFRDEDGNIFDNIHLRLPNGSVHTLKTDVEGRGRLTLNQTTDIGAFESADHMLVFTRDDEYANVWDVSIVTGQRLDTTTTGVPTTAQMYSAPREIAPVTVPTQAAKGNGAVKRQRSAAQLANDERLRNRNKPQSQGNAPTVNVPVSTPQANSFMQGYLADTGIQLTAPVTAPAAMPQRYVRVIDEMERVTDDSAAFDQAFTPSREHTPIPAKGFDYVRPLPRRASH